MIRTLINFVGFQAGWFVCAIVAARQNLVVAPVVVAGLVLLHLALRRQRWRRELVILAAVAPLGAAVDTVIVASGLVQMTGRSGADALVFLWFLAFWANFAVTLNAALAWLQGRPLFAVIFGAVGGPAAYLGAEALGAIALDPRRTLALGVLAVYWAVAFPLALEVARRLGGSDEVSAAPG